MPLRITRVSKPEVRNDNALRVAATATTLTKELSALAMFPPVTASVSVLLLILDTLKSVEDNKGGCIDLALRCAQILLDLDDLMRGRWNHAPPALLKNLERYTEILQSIHKFMISQANGKWAKRFLKRASIEASITDFNKKLSDASQMFQIAMLIDIGHHILPQSRDPHHSEPEAIEKSGEQQPPEIETKSEVPPPYSSRQGSMTEETKEAGKPTCGDESAVLVQGNAAAPTSDDDTIPKHELVQVTEEELVTDGVLEDHGFRRYHSSEVRPTGRSKIKSGWWADTAAADVGGQASLVKYYAGNSRNDALKKWLRDVKMLQNMFHPNLPHMTGYSDEESPTPFILLSDARTNAPDKLVNHILKTEGVAPCLTLLGKYYSDIIDATAYVQRQLGLTESQVQDFVEKTDFRVNASKTIIMGLPPAKEGMGISWRNYDLSHTVAQTALSMLPAKGTVQHKLEHYQDEKSGQDPLKIAHLVSLAKGLLSVGKSSQAPLLTKLLEDENSSDFDDFSNFDDQLNINLKQLRELSLQAGTHNFYWTEMSAIPPHRFAVGDYGYVPKGAHFADFVKLGNIYIDELANIPIMSRTYGSQFSWEGKPIRHVEIENFCLPGDVYCWPISVPRGAQIDCQIDHSERMSDVNDAWRVLFDNSRSLATKFNIQPENLILITAAGKNQSFYIKDFGNQAPMHNPFHKSPMKPMHFPHPHSFMNMNHATMSIPTIMYLLTASGADHQPYWSHQPMHLPNTPRPSLKHGWVQNIGYCHGYLQWIQLLKEDFDE